VGKVGIIKDGLTKIFALTRIGGTNKKSSRIRQHFLYCKRKNVKQIKKSKAFLGQPPNEREESGGGDFHLLYSSFAPRPLTPWALEMHSITV
jgi:hypothetical protein